MPRPKNKAKITPARKNKQPNTELPPPPPKPHPKVNIKARTPNQKVYLEMIQDNDITFGIGAAGSGKTLLAVASGLQALQNKDVEKIIFVRPAVETGGEKLGYLPGTLEEKITPYLIPLLDAAKDFLPKGGIEELIKSGKVELATLAFMRGRSLRNSFIILDEAQNTTVEQLFMAVTRLDRGSKMVVTGDPSQKDLPVKTTSGLTYAMEAFEKVESVAFCNFEESDVVRHPMVSRLIGAHRIWKGDK